MADTNNIKQLLNSDSEEVKSLLKNLLKEVVDENSKEKEDDKNDNTLNPLDIQSTGISSAKNIPKSDDLESRAKEQSKRNSLQDLVSKYYLPDNITGNDRKKFINYYINLINTEYNTRKKDVRFGYGNDNNMFFAGLLFATLPMPKFIDFRDPDIMKVLKNKILSSGLAMQLGQALEHNPM